MSSASCSAAPAKVTGSTAVTSVSGPVHCGGDEADGLAGGVRGVSAERLEAGEQHGRHRFSLRGRALPCWYAVTAEPEASDDRSRHVDLSRAPDHRRNRDGARRASRARSRSCSPASARSARRPSRRPAGCSRSASRWASRPSCSRGDTGCRSPSRGRPPAPRCSPPPGWSRAAGRPRSAPSSSSPRSSCSPASGRTSVG